jgi:hypothetical protein
MAWRSLHWLNPRAHTVNGHGPDTADITPAPLQGWGRSSLPHPAVRKVFVSWPEALRGGWAVMNSLKGMNGTPKPSSVVTCVGTRDRLQGASPTNGLWRRSTRSTSGAGLTAGANRTTRARTCGEGVQASNGCPRRGACVMQESAHVGGSHREGGAHGPPLSWTYALGGPEGPALRRLLESVVRCKVHAAFGRGRLEKRTGTQGRPDGCSLAGYLTLSEARESQERDEPLVASAAGAAGGFFR